jgi:hypothetical protein
MLLCLTETHGISIIEIEIISVNKNELAYIDRNPEILVKPTYNQKPKCGNLYNLLFFNKIMITH